MIFLQHHVASGRMLPTQGQLSAKCARTMTPICSVSMLSQMKIGRFVRSLLESRDTHGASSPILHYQLKNNLETLSRKNASLEEELLHCRHEVRKRIARKGASSRAV